MQVGLTTLYTLNNHKCGLLSNLNSAKKSDAIHFRLDSADISVEIGALNEIVSKYLYGLETGQLDLEAYLPLMLEEMDRIGMDNVMHASVVDFHGYNHLRFRFPKTTR